VLPQEAVSGTAAVNLPGFPGMWTPGEPIAVSEIARYGLFESEQAVLDRADELGLPLERVEVADSAGDMPFPPNHIPSAVEAAEEAVAETRRPRSHAEADALADELGVEFSSDGLTLRQKNDELLAAVATDAAEGDDDQVEED